MMSVPSSIGVPESVKIFACVGRRRRAFAAAAEATEKHEQAPQN